MAGNEQVPLLRKRLAKAEGKVKRKRDKRNCMLTTLMICLMALVFGGMVVVKKASDPNMDTQSIHGKAHGAKAMVSRDKHGEYSVELAPGTITSETTFAELASIMIHPWYEASIMAIYDDPNWKSEGGVDPFNVNKIRLVMRVARDMLDIFSPVFPNDEYYEGAWHPRASEDADHSIWRKLRKQFKEGYSVLGDLQDLFDVTYTDKMLKKRQDAVHHWRKDFKTMTKTYRIRRYLYSDYSTGFGGIDPNGHYRHRSSHLFWSDTNVDDLPNGHDPGLQSVRALGKLQLQNCLVYLDTIKNYTTVMPEENEEMFHNLRKETRVFNDLYGILGDIMVPDNETVEGDDTITTLQSRLEIFDVLVKKLGEINDNWMAHKNYVEEGSHQKKQKKLEKEIDKDWVKFLEWQEENDLDGTFQYVIDQMNDQ